MKPADAENSSSSWWRSRRVELQSRFHRILKDNPWTYWVLLILSIGAMLVAFPASSLLTRLYYADGGRSKWIISWVAVSGWPLTALLLVSHYFLQSVSPTPLTPKLCLSYIVLGFLSAVDNLMFAWAYAFLPASTASLVASSSLVFSAIFGRLIVGNKINASALNAIIIITAGTVLVGLDSNSDRLPGISSKQYALGFVLDVLGSALHGLIFALSELLFVKILGRRSFHVVLEQQTIVSLFAFVFTTIGVVVNKDFNAMRSEASEFKHGRSAYSLVLIWGAITFQLGVTGGTAILYLASTVMAGVLNAVRVPITSLAAVALFHDPMSGFKILSLLLSVWGFGSYIYGFSSLSKSSEGHDEDSDQADIIESLRSRVYIISDEAEQMHGADAENMSNTSTKKPVHPLLSNELSKPFHLVFPRRVLIPWLEGVLVCDYLLPSETLEDIRERCKELLSMNIEDEILEPETTATATTTKSFWDVVHGDSEQISDQFKEKPVFQSSERSTPALSNLLSSHILTAALILLIAIIVGTFMFLPRDHNSQRT